MTQTNKIALEALEKIDEAKTDKEKIKIFSRVPIQQKYYLVRAWLDKLSHNHRTAFNAFMKRKGDEPFTFLDPEASDDILSLCKIVNYLNDASLHSEKTLKRMTDIISFGTHDLSKSVFLMHNDQKKIEAIKNLKFLTISEKYAALDVYIKQTQDESFKIIDLFNIGNKKYEDYRKFKFFLADHFNYSNSYFQEKNNGFKRERLPYKKSFSEEEYIQFLNTHKDNLKDTPFDYMIVYKTYAELRAISEVFEDPFNKKLTVAISAFKDTMSQDHPYHIFLTGYGAGNGFKQSLIDDLAQDLKTQSNRTLFNEVISKNNFLYHKHCELILNIHAKSNFTAIENDTFKTLLSKSKDNYFDKVQLSSSYFSSDNGKRIFFNQNLDAEALQFYVNNHKTLSSNFVTFLQNLDLDKVFINKKEIAEKLTKELKENTHLNNEKDDRLMVFNQIDSILNIRPHLKIDEIVNLYFHVEADDKTKALKLRYSIAQNPDLLKNNPDIEKYLEVKPVNLKDEYFVEFLNTHYSEQFLKNSKKSLDLLDSGKFVPIGIKILHSFKDTEYLTKMANNIILEPFQTHSQLEFLSHFCAARPGNAEYTLGQNIDVDKLVENYILCLKKNKYSSIKDKMQDYASFHFTFFLFDQDKPEVKDKIIYEYRRLMTKSITSLINTNIFPQKSANLSFLCASEDIQNSLNTRAKEALDTQKEKTMLLKMRRINKKVRATIKTL